VALVFALALAPALPPPLAAGRDPAGMSTSELGPDPPDPGVCGPVAEGMSSQYWLTALTVGGLEHGLLGSSDATAELPPSAAQAKSAQTRRCLPLRTKTWPRC
jgi:hypothetical protein